MKWDTTWGKFFFDCSVGGKWRSFKLLYLIFQILYFSSLGHSGEGSSNGTEAYLDQQGIMGISYGKDDQRLCYNPAKSYQLGWYDDKVKTINPLARDSDDSIGQTGMSLFTMNGVSDYEKNDDALIVLRLEQNTSGKDFYIGYNRKDGINIDTPEDGDKITIVRKEEGLPDEFGASTKVASLEPGESHVIEDYDETGSRVKISFIGLRDGNATIKVADVQRTTIQTTVKTTFKTTKKGKAVNREKSINRQKNDSCAPHRIEFMTDSSPEKIKWFILEDGGIGRAYATSPVYTETGTLYRSQICLPYDRSYNFYLKYGDGESSGRETFSVYDQQDNIILSDSSKAKTLSNGVQVRSFVAAVTNPSYLHDLYGVVADSSVERPETGPTKPSKVKPRTVSQPIMMQRRMRKMRNGGRRKVPRKSSAKDNKPSDTDGIRGSNSSTLRPCKDHKQSSFTWRQGKRRLSCQEISEKGKCDMIWFKTNKPLWRVCRRSCQRCEELIFV